MALLPVLAPNGTCVPICAPNAAASPASTRPVSTTPAPHQRSGPDRPPGYLQTVDTGQWGSVVRN